MIPSEEIALKNKAISSLRDSASGIASVNEREIANLEKMPGWQAKAAHTLRERRLFFKPRRKMPDFFDILVFMSIYDDLAPIYDELFPQNPEATSFLLGLAASPDDGRGIPRRVLDIGCATASQLLDLAASGWEAFGLEPSEAMRARAAAKAERAGLGLSIAEGGMLDARGRFPKGHFGLLLCIGNTLPYLGDEAELREFLSGAAGLLAPGGSIVLQTLNYGRTLRLLRSGTFAFPDIGAGGSEFRRHYEEAQGGRLTFVTELLQEGKETAREAGALTPFGPELLAGALREAGFEEPRARSGWGPAASSFSADSDGYLILSARMPT